jgi:hypothetical protein
MASRSKLLAQVLALCVASAALGAGTSGVSSSGASIGMMGTSRSTSGTPASASGRSTTTRSGGSGMYGSRYGPAPAPDPNRRISEQDCTKPIVLDGGNLRCK